MTGRPSLPARFPARVWVGLGMCLLAVAAVAQAVAAARLPWNGSRVLGSPEPPPLFRVERVFPALSFREPTEIAFIPGTRLGLVLEHAGGVFVFSRDGGAEARKIAELQSATGRDGEAYSLVFHPGFLTNRFVYVALAVKTNPAPVMRISRFVLSADPLPRLDPASEQRIIEWPSGGHNGCGLAFGLDGYLYISSGDGDGPAPPDPRKTGQNLDDLLSCVLRIDVDRPAPGKAYGIPAGNPFVTTHGALPEIWAYGFRNPWKISIDPRDGALWVGDVGWEAWELVFRVDHGGFNGGWSIVEGPQPVNTSWKRGPTAIESPVAVHPHTEAASITGGYVYRGRQHPDLQNEYVYGDWETGKMWALGFEKGAVTRRREIADAPFRIVGFGLDQDNELYVLDFAGGIYQLRRSPPDAMNPDFPKRLSQTGLMASAREYRWAEGVVPYETVVSAWADHATTDFAVALPGSTRIGTTGPDWVIPTNSVFTRTFSMEMAVGKPGSRRRLETQLFHWDGVDWNGYSYRWLEDQSDAVLVGREGENAELTIADPEAPGGRREQTWRFHSRAECMRCHMTRFGFLNSFIPEQFTRKTTGPDGQETTSRALLETAGILGTTKPREKPFALVNPADGSAGLEPRARSWLHANCGHCHRESASGAVMMFLHAEMPLDKMLTLGVPPSRGGFGLDHPSLLHPGDPYRSALLYRVLTPGGGRMPILGSTVVDEAGTRLLRDWIASLPQPGTTAQPGVTGAAAAAVVRALERKAPEDLAKADALLKTTGGAMALALAVAEPGTPAAVRTLLAARASAMDQPAARDLFERFLPAAERRKLLGPAIDPAPILARQGDADTGRKLFFSTTGQCASCHRIGGEGKDVGPDLSRIGAKYPQAGELLGQVLQPNRRIDPAWIAHAIETRSGESHTGFVLRNEPDLLHFRLIDGNELKLSRKEIVADKPQALSVMPEGLLQAFTAQEAADLIEFLIRLR